MKRRQVHLSHRGRPNRKSRRLERQAPVRIRRFLASLEAAEDSAPRGTPERQGKRRASGAASTKWLRALDEIMAEALA